MQMKATKVLLVERMDPSSSSPYSRKGALKRIKQVRMKLKFNALCHLKILISDRDITTNTNTDTYAYNPPP